MSIECTSKLYAYILQILKTPALKIFDRTKLNKRQNTFPNGVVSVPRVAVIKKKKKKISSKIFTMLVPTLRRTTMQHVFLREMPVLLHAGSNLAGGK